MSDTKGTSSLPFGGLGRRKFINTAALAGLTAGVAACTDKGAPASTAAPAGAASAAPAASHVSANSTHLKPGELDT